MKLTTIRRDEFDLIGTILTLKHEEETGFYYVLDGGKLIAKTEDEDEANEIYDRASFAFESINDDPF